MRLIKPSVEILEQGPGLQGIYDMIELCGKTSYKSEVKGGEEAKKFVEARINEGHYAVLEFGTVYLRIPMTTHYSGDANIYLNSPYCKVSESNGFAFKDIFDDPVDCWCITTNLRFICENDLWDDIDDFLCEPTKFHYRRYCARIVTDRATSMEMLRHRTMSFCQESTRYCNYSKDKFGNELTCIIPDKESWKGLEAYYQMINCLDEIEQVYMKALEEGVTPQVARAILPNMLKTEVCMCGFEDAWEHFFDLRLFQKTGKVHPDMLSVAQLLYDNLKKHGYE